MASTEASYPKGDKPEDYLTPQQRAEAIAEILSTVAVRIVRNRHELQDPDSV